MDQDLQDAGYRLYHGTEIDVYFNLSICQHSGNCVRGNSNLFKLNRQPWIMPDNVDAKTVFHGAQTHRGGLAVDHGHLHVEARVDDAVKLAQTLDDHGMLLFNDIAGVGKQ